MTYFYPGSFQRLYPTLPALLQYQQRQQVLQELRERRQARRGEGISGAQESINTALRNLTDQTFWIKLGVLIVGVLFVFIGLAALASKPVAQVASTVSPAAQIAKRVRR